MKAERDVQREAEAQKKAGLIRHELAWLRRGAKARTSKQKARIDRAHALMEQPDEKSAAPLKLASPTQRLGKKVIEVRNVSKSYDGLPLLSDFSFSFTRGGRIGIIGPNGTGKTTFLDILAGRTNPDAGAVEIGQTVAIGYYDQESAALKEDLRVIDYVKEMAEIIKTADGSIITASQMLERFLFPPAVQYTLVGSLSGGERRRLYLLRLLMGAPNVLLLDEPTNDFDIDTLMALEDYLDAFDGCLVTVSHDRYFLDRTVDHLIRFDENGQQRIYPGNYAAFLEIDARETEDLAAQVKPDSESTEQRPAAASHPAPASKSEAPRKLSYKEKRELELLEGRIMEAEERKAVIEADLVETATDFESANDLYEELKELNDRVEADIDRWGELMDRV
jgi:ATP-binding cassette subfamily F protein uup